MHIRSKTYRFSFLIILIIMVILFTILFNLNYIHNSNNLEGTTTSTSSTVATYHFNIPHPRFISQDKAKEIAVKYLNELGITNYRFINAYNFGFTIWDLRYVFKFEGDLLGLKDAKFTVIVDGITGKIAGFTLTDIESLNISCVPERPINKTKIKEILFSIMRELNYTIDENMDIEITYMKIEDNNVLSINYYLMLYGYTVLYGSGSLSLNTCNYSVIGYSIPTPVLWAYEHGVFNKSLLKAMISLDVAKAIAEKYIRDKYKTNVYEFINYTITWYYIDSDHDSNLDYPIPVYMLQYRVLIETERGPYEDKVSVIVDGLTGEIIH